MACQSKFYLMRGQVNLDHEFDIVGLNCGKHEEPGESRGVRKIRKSGLFNLLKTLKYFKIKFTY